MLAKATGIIFLGRSIPFAPSVARENWSHEQAGLMASNSFLLGPGNFSGSMLNLGVCVCVCVCVRVCVHMPTCGCSGIYKQNLEADELVSRYTNPTSIKHLSPKTVIQTRLEV